MPMSIQRQADQYNLDVAPVEHVARHDIEEMLRPAHRIRPNGNNPRYAGDESEMLEQLLREQEDHPEMGVFNDDAHEQRVRDRLYGPDDGLPKGFDREYGGPDSEEPLPWAQQWHQRDH